MPAFLSRVVSCGSSAATVEAPTTTTSTTSRSWCETFRDASEVIHFDFPVEVASFPSSVIAAYAVTQGSPVFIAFMKGWLSESAAPRSTCGSTSTPAARSLRTPFPFTSGFGSLEA